MKQKMNALLLLAQLDFAAIAVVALVVRVESHGTRYGQRVLRLVMLLCRRLWAGPTHQFGAALRAGGFSRRPNLRLPEFFFTLELYRAMIKLVLAGAPRWRSGRCTKLR